MKKHHKVSIVIVGAIILTTLAIEASDHIRTQYFTHIYTKDDSALCPEGMRYIVATDSHNSFCVDVFEVSPSSQCPVSIIQNAKQTQENLNESSCVAVSRKGVLPWRFVSFTQAQQLCARTGKHLPTNSQWFTVALSLADQSHCITHAPGALPAGSSDCATVDGIFDIVGNVWEWVDAQNTNGRFDNQNLPTSGYVQLVDTQGVVLQTGHAPIEEYGNDYAVLRDDGVFGMLRGGFYGSGDDAGIFAQNFAAPFNLKTEGVGFRCVQDI